MSYYAREQLEDMGFKLLGENVKISTRASLYDCSSIKIGDNSRVDDFCVISGNIRIGRNVHITPQCLLAGGEKGIFLDDFSTVAYGVKIFTQSDDYSGETMTNSTIPKTFKNEQKSSVKVGRHSIIGAGSIILPGVVVGEGGSIGANSLVLKSTEDWSIYIGSPAKKLKNRKRDLLKLECEYLSAQE